MKNLIYTLILSCCFLGIKAQQYQINAELTGFENGTKVFLKDIIADKAIDSAILTEGKLSMKGRTTYVRAVWLCTSYKKEFYFTNLLIGADRVSIKADRADFPWFVEVKGSKSQDVANFLNQQIRHLWKSRDSLLKIVMPLAMGKQNDSVKAVIRPMAKMMSKLDSTREAITKKFIADHLNSIAGLKELYSKKGDYTKEALNAMMAKVTPDLMNSLFGKLLINYQKVGNILKKGDQFFDFSAKDLNGKSYQLSAFKGKYILIDFVETYCPPCVAAAPDLEKLSRKYADLQVISFYVEKDRNVVQMGLNRDRPSWPAIWDGKGPESEIKLKYGVYGYPTFVLISPEGKIIMHSSGFSRDDNGIGSLEKDVDQLMQKAK